MTEAERTALIQQINRHAHLSSHQMEAVMGALHHLKWEQKMGQTETARCEPPEGTKEGTYHVLTNGSTEKMGKWENQRWYIPGQNSQTAGEAWRDGWRYSHAMSLDPPHPHAELRDAVVAAAMGFFRDTSEQNMLLLVKATHDLHYAQNPPNPEKELIRAMAVMTLVGPSSEAAAHLGIAIDRAIEALERGNAA